MRVIKKIFFVIYLFLISNSVFAQKINFVRVSFSNENPSNSVGIAWNTPSVNDPSIVEYGESISYGLKAYGSAFNAGGKLSAVHEVEINGLKPDTLYHYRVGGDGEWSIDYTFKTAPSNPCTPFTFIVLGDNRSFDASGPSPIWNSILMEVAEYKPSFILNSGDIVEDGKEDHQWFNFFSASEPVLAFIPLMTAIGNHDSDFQEGENANYNKVFFFPRNYKTNTEDFYYFIFGNLIVVSISTETFKDGNPPFSLQAEYLDEVLTNNPKLWKIVFLHHPNYTSHKKIFGLKLNHPPNEKKQNQALIPVFDKHHVDFVFSGHNHWYERFKPLKGGEVVQSPNDGTIYITSGGAGAPTYGIFDAVKYICGNAKGSYKCAGEHHYIKITIENNKLNLEVWASKAQLFSESEKNKKMIDSLYIEKPFPDGINPCAVKSSKDEDISISENDKNVSEISEDAIKIEDKFEKIEESVIKKN